MSLAQATTAQAKKGGVWIYVVFKLQVDTLLVGFWLGSWWRVRFGEKKLGGWTCLSGFFWGCLLTCTSSIIIYRMLPWKLTYHPKNEVWRIVFLLKWFLFRVNIYTMLHQSQQLVAWMDFRGFEIPRQKKMVQLEIMPQNLEMPQNALRGINE